MKFGKLLAAGKNIFATRDGIAYRDAKVPLPKFNSDKNPFATTTMPEAQKNLSELPAQKPVAAKTQKMPTISSEPKPLATWASKLNPMAMLRGEPKETRQPVQAELSLEKVKVVHNDLSDADVEIVPMKSRGVPELEPAKKSWEILGERLMRVTAL
ncbi:MAG TPA: hypothetical protein VFV23_07945 [Verrucomicrobiae bacterium]|nr:hypothetical protein [Verrucomicrobiae bacterium]